MMCHLEPSYISFPLQHSTDQPKEADDGERDLSFIYKDDSQPQIPPAVRENNQRHFYAKQMALHYE